MNYMPRGPVQQPPMLIKGIFVLLALTVVAAVVMLFALRVNEVVDVKQGELIATLPRAVYRAPYDVTVERILVREGNTVQPDDTLMVLDNPDVTARFTTARQAYEASLVSQELLPSMISNGRQRIANLQRQLYSHHQVFELDQQVIQSEVSTLGERLAGVREQTDLAHQAFARDSLLHAQSLLSKAEYETSYSTWLTSVRGEQTLQGEYDSRSKQLEKRGPEADLEGSRLREELLNAEAELLQQLERQAVLAVTIERQRSELAAQRQAYAKQFVVAAGSGSVHFLYNRKASSDLVSKGEILVEVVPGQSNVYARLELRQDQVKEVAVGQPVHLKLDAYSYYKYGVVKGRVQYVSSPDNQNRFYVNVDVQVPENGLELKPGYRVEAEIIQGRVPVYEFMLKRIFQKASPEPETSPPSAGPEQVVTTGRSQ